MTKPYQRWIRGPHRKAEKSIAPNPLLLGAWLGSGYMVKRYYQSLVDTHGTSPQAMAEREDEKAITFYDELFCGVPLPMPLSVLDIGCGMGDVISYLQEHNVPIASYLGLDLIETFVRTGEQRYGAPYRFYHGNFVNPSFKPKEQFAVVVNMGVMVSRVLGYEAYIAYSCQKMMHYATHAVLFNAITSVQAQSRNFTTAQRIGHITTIAKPRLIALLDRVTRDTAWEYTFHDAHIYPDAMDTFVYLRPRAPAPTPGNYKTIME